MKTLFYLLLILFATTAFCQNYSIQITESNEAIGVGKNNAMVVNVFENDLDKVEKEWKNTIKNYKNEKTNLHHHSLFADNVVINEISTGTVDIYTNFIEKKDNKSVGMIVAFDLGGVYMSSNQHGDKFLAAKKIVYDFAVKVTKAALDEQLSVENKKLEKLLEKKDDLEKDKINMNSRIEEDRDRIKKAQEDIAKNEENLKKNEKDQQDQQLKIDEQKKMINEFQKRIDSVR